MERRRKQRERECVCGEKRAKRTGQRLVMIVTKTVELDFQHKPKNTMNVALNSKKKSN